MPDPINMYRRAAEGALAVAEHVRPDELDLPTPCSEWSVQDLLDHLAGGTRYLGAAIAGTEPAPVTGASIEDLRSGVAGCLDGLSDPSVLGRTCASPLGFEWTVADAAVGTSMDLVVHTWDLATATGQAVELDAVVVDACIAAFLPHMPEAGRAAGIIGPAVEVGPDATAPRVLLGALGRRA